MSDCGLDGLTFKRPSLVKPQFAVECDLKGIVQRFLRTGQLPEIRTSSEIQDATNLPDSFSDLMAGNVAVKQAFDMLPLEERNKFNNDPEAWAASKIAGEDAGTATPSAASDPATPFAASEPVTPSAASEPVTTPSGVVE